MTKASDPERTTPIGLARYACEFLQAPEPRAKPPSVDHSVEAAANAIRGRLCGADRTKP